MTMMPIFLRGLAAARLTALCTRSPAVVSAVTAASARRCLLSPRPSPTCTLPAAVFAARQMSTSTAIHRDGWLEVEETGRGTFQNTVCDGRHIALADEPGSVPGGMDSGMNPYGFLLSALGACTSMTIRMYAEKKGIPLEKVRVLLKHDRVWAKDCTNCVSKSGRVDTIAVDVQLFGDKLTADDHARLMEIANRCPVHTTLNTETIISVNELKDDQQ